jgi:hypothetical protein
MQPWKTNNAKHSQPNKDKWCRSCIHITNFNLKHFKVVEAMGLNVIASKSIAIELVP